MGKTGRKNPEDLFNVDLRKIWKEWELRAMVLFTLGTQMNLLLLGNRRKSSHNVWLRVLVWCAYSASGSVATVALGILASKLGDVTEKSGRLDDDSKLVALWAPLLLLLLGGPDTITAYSLEDNALWLRHLLGLGVQTGTTAYVLFMAWTSSSLSVLSLVMFLVGLIKYGERSWVLWLASKDKLREMLTPSDPHPDYVRFTEMYSLKQAEGYLVTLDQVIEIQEPRLYAHGDVYNIVDTEVGPNLKVRAYSLLHIFKCLFVDLKISFEDGDLSRQMFESISWHSAFELIAIELGFMYDFLYTKAMLLYSVWGIGCRFITFSLTLLMLALFSVAEKYPHCSMIDLYITYALLAVILLFDIYSILILLSSDWTDVWLSVHNKSCALLRAVKYLQLPKQPQWSDSVAQFSLLSSCINENPLVCHGILKRLNINEKLDKYHYTTFKEVPPLLKEVIFRHVRVRCLRGMPTDISEIRIAFRGYEFTDEIWSTQVEFDRVILTWHIATALCYYSDRQSELPECIQSMLLSRYMLYLLVICPFMLPTGISEMMIRDTFAEATKFFEEHPISNSKPEPEERCTHSGNPSGKRTKKALQIACEMLLEVNIEVPPAKVNGGRNKSVLFDGCQLAKVLNKQPGGIRKWEMILNLWVEVLLYAASQSRGDCHAHQLRRGGEFLTHVWLLLAHLRLTDHFELTQGSIIAELILR